MALEWKQTIAAIHGETNEETLHWVRSLESQLPAQDEPFPSPTEESHVHASATDPGSGRWWSLAASVLLALFLFSGNEPPTNQDGANPSPVAMTLIRGDIDASGELDWRDLQGLIDFLQEDGPAPRCLAAGDFDEDGEITLDDSVLALSHLTEGAGLDSTILYSQTGTSLPCFDQCP